MGVVNWIIGGSSGLMDTVVGLVYTEATADQSTLSAAEASKKSPARFTLEEYVEQWCYTASEAGDPCLDGVIGSGFMSVA